MARKRSLSTDRARHNEVLRAVAHMRREAGDLALQSLEGGWPYPTVSYLYRLYDVLAEFEAQARGLEDQGQLPL